MATPELTDPEMDARALYRDEIFTDRKIGTIRVMTPVTAEGAPDLARTVVYVGETQILTNAGMLPLTFEIDARSLGEAVQKFGAATKVALEDTMRELQDLRRQAASQIVVPEPGAASTLLGPGGGRLRGR